MSKLVLILNCGSSSLKFAVMDAETGEDMLSGLAECFNLDDARIKWKLHGVKGEAMLGAGAAHQAALDHIVGHILRLTSLSYGENGEFLNYSIMFRNANDYHVDYHLRRARD